MKNILRVPSIIGIILGTLLMAVSLTPSLIPRPWLDQVAISALSFVCGYAIGVLLSALWRYLELPSIPQRAQRWAVLGTILISGLVLLSFAFRMLTWQNNLREVVEMEPVDSVYSVRVVLLAAALAAVLILLFRLLGWLGGVIIGFVMRYLPQRYGRVLGILLVAVLYAALFNGVLLRYVANVANSAYVLQNNANYENVAPPTSALRSGSPDSLVSWDSLGREGRRFVGTGPSPDDIAAFWDGAQAREPIRIYIGKQSAETPQERADLALEELIRTGAFDRHLLLLVTATGNGWVDANALDSLEYMYGGDTAIVAFQYSYLPSTFALVVDPSSAPEASVTMFDEIHGYWQDLDESTRPEFYLHGLSLGAYGSQAAVSSVALFNDLIDGALWAGPPFVSEFWRRITNHRDEGTPVWRPVYQGGTTIRFTNTGEGLQEAPEAWQDNRFIYLQQAGDPIVFFSIDSLYREPQWMQEESRSPKVPPDMEWYPVVTFWQLVFDMVLATSDTLPDGNGHRYGSDSYIESWVALTQPSNWSDEQTEELKTLFNNMGNPNKP